VDKEKSEVFVWCSVKLFCICSSLVGVEKNFSGFFVEREAQDVGCSVEVSVRAVKGSHSAAANEYEAQFIVCAEHCFFHMQKR
jgi:hypothetical protein